MVLKTSKHLAVFVWPPFGGLKEKFPTHSWISLKIWFDRYLKFSNSKQRLSGLLFFPAPSIVSLVVQVTYFWTFMGVCSHITSFVLTVLCVKTKSFWGQKKIASGSTLISLIASWNLPFKLLMMLPDIYLTYQELCLIKLAFKMPQWVKQYFTMWAK